MTAITTSLEPLKNKDKIKVNQAPLHAWNTPVTGTV
jgi:hypothetical protein